MKDAEESRLSFLQNLQVNLQPLFNIRILRLHSRYFIITILSVKALFLASIGGVSALFSFSYAFAAVKKNDNTKYDAAATELYESGSKLAVRALKWGSLYAITGCGLIMFGVWKLSGAKNVNDYGKIISIILYQLFHHV